MEMWSVDSSMSLLFVALAVAFMAVDVAKCQGKQKPSWCLKMRRWALLAVALAAGSVALAMPRTMPNALFILAGTAGLCLVMVTVVGLTQCLQPASAYARMCAVQSYASMFLAAFVVEYFVVMMVSLIVSGMK